MGSLVEAQSVGVQLLPRDSCSSSGWHGEEGGENVARKAFGGWRVPVACSHAGSFRRNASLAAP
jgi:hypothetical protein